MCKVCILVALGCRFRAHRFSSTTTADNWTIGRVLVVVTVVLVIIVITVITVVIVLATVIIIALSRYQLELFLGTKWNSS